MESILHWNKGGVLEKRIKTGVRAVGLTQGEKRLVVEAIRKITEIGKLEGNKGRELPETRFYELVK